MVPDALQAAPTIFRVPGIPHSADGVPPSMGTCQRVFWSPYTSWRGA
jgi:hypothetical protein